MQHVKAPQPAACHTRSPALLRTLHGPHPSHYRRTRRGTQSDVHAHAHARLNHPTWNTSDACSMTPMNRGVPTSATFHSTAMYLLAGIWRNGPSTSWGVHDWTCEKDQRTNSAGEAHKGHVVCGQASAAAAQEPAEASTTGPAHGVDRGRQPRGTWRAGGVGWQCAPTAQRASSSRWR